MGWFILNCHWGCGRIQKMQARLVSLLCHIICEREGGKKYIIWNIKTSVVIFIP